MRLFSWSDNMYHEEVFYNDTNSAWRATATDYDVEYCRHGHPSGGAMSLLWHRKLGPVLIGTMGEYQLVEPNNMQLLRNGMPACLTPRIEYQQDGVLFRSIYDKAAWIWCTAQEIRVHVKGRMTSADGALGDEFILDYRMDQCCFEVRAGCSADSVVLVLPVVSRQGEEIVLEKDGCGISVIRENSAVLTIHMDSEWELSGIEKRTFSPVDGMQIFLLRLVVPPGKKVSCRFASI